MLTATLFASYAQYSVAFRKYHKVQAREVSSVRCCINRSDLYKNHFTSMGVAPLLARCCFTVPSNQKSQGLRGVTTVCLVYRGIVTQQMRRIFGLMVTSTRTFLFRTGLWENAPDEGRWFWQGGANKKNLQCLIHNPAVYIFSFVSLSSLSGDIFAREPSDGLSSTSSRQVSLPLLGCCTLAWFHSFIVQLWDINC